MTLVIAVLVLLSLPIFMAMLRQQPARRLSAFTAIGALPFLTNVPVEGFIYGWAGWEGTSLGYGVSLIDTLALALIMTRRQTPGSLPLWPLLAMYGATLFFSIFFSSMWVPATFALWQLGRVALLFAAVGGESHRPEVRKSLLLGLALGLIYQAGYVITQKLGGVVQAPGTFIHQNILGLAIELSVLPLIGAVLGGNRSKVVMVGIAAALICVAGSGSRGTMGIAGGAILILLLVSVVRRSTPFKFKVVGMAALGLALATPFALETLKERFGEDSFVTEEDARHALEEAARAMAADHPFGVGANQFVLVSNRDGYAQNAGVSWQEADRSKPPHNAYLVARAETGYLGELTFILLLGVPMFMAFRLAFADRSTASGELALGSAFALAANAVHNNYEFAVHTFPVQALLFMNLGVIAALVRERRAAIRHNRKAATATAAPNAPSGGPARASPGRS